MGTELLAFFRKRMKHTWKVAFFSAFILFLLIHFYKITNYLPNHDTLYNFYSTQNVVGSGRWFLQYACGISSYFDLPWFNGLLCAVYLGLTTVCIVELLNIQNPVLIVLTAAILAGTPSTTETLFFGYTADGYLLGLAMGALSACLSCKEGKLSRYAASTVLLCLSCGIYQSCVSFAAMCCICYLVLQLLNRELSVKDAWHWIGRHVLIYAVAMACYYGIWKLMMHFEGISATSYQGIDSLGKISIATIIQSCIQSVSNLLLFFVEWNILEHPISTYAALNLVFLLCFVIVVVTALIRSRIYRSGSRLVLILVCLAASVPVLSIWAFLSPGVVYRPMMLHGICLYYVLAMILFDKWIPARFSTAFAALVMVIVFNFSIMANISYFWMNKCYEKTFYRGSELMHTIVSHQRNGQSIDTVAFIGNRQDEVYSDDSLFTQKVHVLSACLEEDLLYDHIHTYLFLKNSYDLEIACASDAQLEKLEALDQVRQMPIWPAEGSSQVIDGVLVVRIGE